MSSWQLANFLGDPLKYMLTTSSDSLGRKVLLSLLKMMVEMLDNFSLRVSSLNPGFAS